MVSRETILLTQEGNLRISRIEQEVHIFTKDKDNTLISKRAKVTEPKIADEYYALELTNGIVIKGNFSVMMENGEFKDVKDVKKGDVLKSCVVNGRDDDSDLAMPKVVLKNEKVEDEITLYGLTTDEYAVDAGIIIK